MSIVGGFDVHRAQITYDYVDTATGQVSRGRIAPADRVHLRAWLARFTESIDVHFAGRRMHRLVVRHRGVSAGRMHVADPGEAAAARGKKQHAKTDKLDALHLRRLLENHRLPESWIPPTHVCETRARVRLYEALQDERGDWMQRVRAVCFHQGAGAPAGPLRHRRPG